MLTIFTPTYNRAYKLPKLYQSLVQQTNQEFEWLIVDDGSTDDTQTLVEGWQSEHKLSIRYVYQINGGKMRAHNKGVSLCQNELFLCVDSDDYLYDEHVVEAIYEKWNSIPDVTKDTLSGILAPRHVTNFNLTDAQKTLPDIDYSTVSDLYTVHNFKSDTALVFRTSVISAYPFPEIEGEKFITESYIYTQIDAHYQFALLNKELIFCEYIADGYTSNWNKLFLKNPKGWKLKYNQDIALTGKTFFLLAWLNAASFVNHDSILQILKESPCKWKSFLMLPVGYVLYKKKTKGVKI